MVKHGLARVVRAENQKGGGIDGSAATVYWT